MECTLGHVGQSLQYLGIRLGKERMIMWAFGENCFQQKFTFPVKELPRKIILEARQLCAQRPWHWENGMVIFKSLLLDIRGVTTCKASTAIISMYCFMKLFQWKLVIICTVQTVQNILMLRSQSFTYLVNVEEIRNNYIKVYEFSRLQFFTILLFFFQLK